ncbi:hypothetical protein KKG24_02845 [Patescibacteria group bacterium]|nr:hypothetical protein [Patescibacteria group bacterium]
MKKELPSITLIGIDCVNLKRLQLAADISTKDITFGSVKLLTSIKSDDPRVIQIPHINSAKKYSDFMIKELYKYIDTNFALIFQHDGFVLNPFAWSDSFLQYDYIGSPWYHLGDLRIGNGGFSLRSKKLIDWLANNWKKAGARIHPEDVFISKFARPYLEQSGMKFAPENIAKQFSMEGNERSVVWNGEFGFHGITWTDISNWLVNHLEYKKQLNYKLDDYTTLMKKYPTYDETVHTFKFSKHNIKNYVQSSKNEKNYEARLTQEKYYDYSKIKIGDTIIFKRSGVVFEDVPIPAFEKRVEKIESFKSFSDLRKAYSKICVTYPIKDIPKWKKPFIKIFGDSIYPKNKPYSIFWFD